jgi:hypothetical protein
MSKLRNKLYLELQSSAAYKGFRRAQGWNHGMPACLGLSGVHRKQILSAFTSGNSHRKQGKTYDEQ